MQTEQPILLQIKHILRARKTWLILGPGIVMMLLVFVSSFSVIEAFRVGIYTWLLWIIIAGFFYVIELGIEGIRSGRQGIGYKLFALALGGFCLIIGTFLASRGSNIGIIFLLVVIGLAFVLYSFGRSEMTGRLLAQPVDDSSEQNTAEK